MLAQSPAAVAIAMPQPATEAASDFEGTLSLKRIVASLQVVLAARRAARNDEYAYWYTIARGM